jgi:nicotinate-nucleotide adenylyltransferase
VTSALADPLYGDLPANARIGVLGGTFDPIHLGHLILAEEARVQLRLDRLYLIPAGDPPHKRAQQVTPVEHRIRMVELATATAPALWVSRIDADRAGPHYSLDTLRLLRAAIGPAATIFFLMGWDSLRDFPTWHQPQALLHEATVVALTRPNVDIVWSELEAALPGLREQIKLLEMPALEISSRVLRQRLSQGVSVQFQVDSTVIAYIEKHQLYRTSR